MEINNDMPIEFRWLVRHRGLGVEPAKILQVRQNELIYLHGCISEHVIGEWLTVPVVHEEK